MSNDAFELEKLRLKTRWIVQGLSETPISYERTSCEIHGALLNASGELIDAFGPNPVHFSCIEAVALQSRKFIVPKPGETLITNDPASGNPRLCDLTLITPAGRYSLALQISIPQLLFRESEKKEKFYDSIEDEGYRIPPTILEMRGKVNPDITNYLSQSGVSLNDLNSILEKARTALWKAAEQVSALEKNWGREKFAEALAILDSESLKIFSSQLRQFSDGEHRAFEILEGDGFDTQQHRVQAKMLVRGESLSIDFSGSAKQLKGPFNLNMAMTRGACFAFFKKLIADEFSVSHSVLHSFSVEVPEGCLLDARHPAPMLGGYYETILKITGALQQIANKAVPQVARAGSACTSNSSLFEVGKRIWVQSFSPAEGASRESEGKNASFSPSVEAVERTYPSVRTLRLSTRDRSSGFGQKNGGEGLNLALKFLEDNAYGKFFSDRLNVVSRGLFGGGNGAKSEIVLNQEKLTQKKSVHFKSGDELVVATAGAGGWGEANASEDDDEGDLNESH